MKRTAVDAKAKSYWEDYYKEYGRSWVRDIPRRIKAAVDEQDGLDKTAASGDAEYAVRPIVFQKVGSALVLEGVYEAGDSKRLFRADFDTEGKLLDFKVASLTGA